MQFIPPPPRSRILRNSSNINLFMKKITLKILRISTQYTKSVCESMTKKSKRGKKTKEYGKNQNTFESQRSQ